MFPLVYGNAIDWTRTAANTNNLIINGANLYAYKDAASPASDAVNVWHALQNSNGARITTPYILDDLGLSVGDVEAVYLWQDVAEGTSLIIPANSISVTTKTFSGTSELFYDPVGSSYKTTVPYIRFEVPSSSIRQGNIVIALRKKASVDSNQTILWSWHIWVSDGADNNGDIAGDGFFTYPVSTRGGVNASNDFLPVTLGWCETGTATKYKDRVWWVKVVQNTSGKELLFRVNQQPEPVVSDATASGTFYQWGRKDPFPPTDGIQESNKACTSYSPTYNPLTGTNGVHLEYTDATNAAHAIRNPYIFYRSSQIMDAGVDAEGHTIGGFYNWMRHTLYPNNLWNMNQGSGTADLAIAKTVYDPCPPGFSLPHKLAYSLFTTTGDDTSNKNEYFVLDRNGDGVLDNTDFQVGANCGWYFYTDASKSSTVFIPAFGVRERQTGNFVYTLTPQWGAKSGSYWTGAGSSYLKGCPATCLDVGRDFLYPHGGESRSYGYPIRPVKEN